MSLTFRSGLGKSIAKYTRCTESVWNGIGILARGVIYWCFAHTLLTLFPLEPSNNSVCVCSGSLLSFIEYTHTTALCYIIVVYSMCVCTVLNVLFCGHSQSVISQDFTCVTLQEFCLYGCLEKLKKNKKGAFNGH